ncbi:MAG: Uma2 family endonuclease [Eubacteriales bacterium]|nr:Uma2 family endonuclease [Eubacteriales bacterium]
MEKDHRGCSPEEKRGAQKTDEEKAHNDREDLLLEPSAAEMYLQDPERFHPARDSRVPEGGGHTSEEYFALPDDLRVELIDGVFYDMASPARIHQVVSLEIAEQLDACLKEHGEPCLLLIAPSDLVLGEDGRTVVQPDLYVFCGINGEKTPGDRERVPDLVVEILSRSNPGSDLWRKRALYQRHGVREYWIVDPHESRILVHLFDGKEEGAPPERYTFEDEVPVRVSGGACRVDFTRLGEKLELLRKLEQELP